MSVDRRDLVVVLVLALGSLAVFLTYWDYGLNDDEGYLLGGVTRILDGQVPYRDFHHTYGPARFYLVAFLFRLFGEDLLVLRGLWLVMRVVVVVLAYLSGRRFLSRPGAVAAALFFMAAPGPWHKSFFHLFLLANLFVLGGLRGKGARGVATAGFLAGVTFLFRQDLGIFVGVSYGALLVLGRWTGESPKRAALFSLSALLAVLPVVIYFTAEGALGAAASKVLLAGATDNRANALPFPPLFHPVSGGPAGAAFLGLRLLYYVPLPLYVVAGVAGLLGLLRRGEGAALFLAALLGAASFNQAVWRSDLAHLLQALACCWLLLPWGAERLRRWSAGLALGAAFALPALIFLQTLVYARTYESPIGPALIASEGLQPIPPYYLGSVSQLRGGTVRLPIRRARVRMAPDEAAYLRAIQSAIDRYSKPGDYMVTVPGFQLLYFLFDRANPTAYVHVRRAFDSPEEEERYARDILEKPTKIVLLRDTPLDGRNERRFSRFAPNAYAAIERGFEPVEEFGNLVIYRRKEAGL
ncbi:MAG: glycosyltransferase family 39 protein [Candidatus Eisenbacteria bacterium]